MSTTASPHHSDAPEPAIPLDPTATYEQWLKQRQTGIGSSDASTIVGLSNYQSPYTLWLEKTGQVPLDPPVDDRTEELRRWGNLLEPVIRDETARRLGVTIDKPSHAWRHSDRAWQHSNVDGFTSDGRIFEAKNTSTFNRRQWVGQIPDHAEIQVHHSALVFGSTQAVVAGLVGGNELHIWEMDINPNICEMLLEAEESFWSHVVSRTAPDVDAHVATMDALTREWKHNPGSREIAPSDVEAHWNAWIDADQAERQAKADKKTALAKITALLDGHDTLTSGKRVWAAVQRGQLNRKKLAAEHPDLVEEYTRPQPVFDLAAFKADHPDVYAAYQTVSVRPKK